MLAERAASSAVNVASVPPDVSVPPAAASQPMSDVKLLMSCVSITVAVGDISQMAVD